MITKTNNIEKNNLIWSSLNIDFLSPWINFKKNTKGKKSKSKRQVEVLSEYRFYLWGFGKPELGIG